MKKIFISLIYVCILFIISGCYRTPFAPSSYLYENWCENKRLSHSFSLGYKFDTWCNKSSSGNLEVQKALLECGFKSPLGNDNIYGGINGIIIAERCMLKSGFSFYAGDLKLHCEQQYYQNEPPKYSACELPLDQIPDRNITKRLNSEWCKHKIYRTYKECQP